MTTYKPLPLADKTIEARKKPHWVYRFYAADGELLYVGLTRNPKQRFLFWMQHKDWGDSPYWENWVKRAVRCSWRQYANYDLADLAERVAIWNEAPSGNRQHHPDYHRGRSDVPWPSHRTQAEAEQVEREQEPAA